MITCRELISFLADYLDHELPDEKNADFERHLERCPSCREYLATYRETIAMAKTAAAAPELRVEDVPEDLVTAILSAARRGA